MAQNSVRLCDMVFVHSNAHENETQILDRQSSILIQKFWNIIL